MAIAGTIIGAIGSVLIPVGLLLILSVANFFPVFNSSKVKATKAQLSAFEVYLDIYQLDIGAYPDSSQGLESLRVPPADLVDPSKWAGPYSKREIPLDPWEGRYHYELISRNQYRIFSCGPDGTAGTGDDIDIEVSK